LSIASVADAVVDRLSPFLGPFNAKIAVKNFAKRSLERNPEDLSAEHLPALLEAMRPMLNTLVGRDSAEALLDEIRREVK
jgi:hypothetical protein